MLNSSRITEVIQVAVKTTLMIKIISLRSHEANSDHDLGLMCNQLGVNRDLYEESLHVSKQVHRKQT